MSTQSPERPIRVCTVTDIVCTRGCGPAECKKLETSGTEQKEDQLVFHTSGSDRTAQIFQPGQRVVSRALVQLGGVQCLEIVMFYPSLMAYGNGQSVPGRVEKEIYGIRDGELALLSIVKGTHIPAHSVPEQFTFPESTEIPSQHR
jgi:hypothetical protein